MLTAIRARSGIARLARGDWAPVILLGAPRSGTKLLRDLLATHPDVDRVPYDINYIWRKGQERVPHDRLDPDATSAADMDFIRRRVSAYHRGGAWLVEKTVSNCLRPRFVSRVLPEARYIHLLRDGRDVVESSLRQWLARPDWRYILAKSMSFPLLDAFGYAVDYATATIRRAFGPPDRVRSIWGVRYPGIERDVRARGLVEVCALQWRHCVETVLEELPVAAPDGWVTIRYEDLVARPAAELDRVAAWLGLRTSIPVTGSPAPRITRTYADRSARALDASDLRAANEILAPALERMGYAPAVRVAVPGTGTD